MSQVTTIQITKDTREELRELGRKGETYDQLICRLMEAARMLQFFEELDRIVETEEFVPLEEV
jgi:hypothetical protein